MKDPEDKLTIDLIESKPKNTHGGWRGGGRPKVDYQTTTMRVDTRLKAIIENLKERLKSGAMNDEDLKAFEELAAI